MKQLKYFIALVLVYLSSNIIFLFARYYNPDIGRFISADIVTPGGGTDLQGLNRYSYCLNNPMIYVDPTGNDPKVQDATLTQIKIDQPQILFNEYHLQEQTPKSLSFQTREMNENYQKLVDSLSIDLKGTIEMRDALEKNPIPLLGTLLQGVVTEKKDNFEMITGARYDNTSSKVEGMIFLAMLGMELTTKGVSNPYLKLRLSKNQLETFLPTLEKKIHNGFLPIEDNSCGLIFLTMDNKLFGITSKSRYFGTVGKLGLDHNAYYPTTIAGERLKCYDYWLRKSGFYNIDKDGSSANMMKDKFNELYKPKWLIPPEK